ncbi:tail fiber assembly protein [Providencia rettgeri]|uniref:tail fiber assembly protein n=1 Tax=Providencia rettgeri TaxID=587 RepID=UPI001BAD27E2|nr:tail fiber assembly protein [Providencia rettgeri]MBS0859646.1 tail fiber assembly protein [Providencia rettgeri]MBS0873011.1 tail fiber assembly protein [Providencia rettgeri]MBS0920695.1 tail fiber assembly protein [Providencia rettgeri]
MYFYSKKTNAFYPDELKNDYIDSGTFPDDVVEVDIALYIEFSAPPPAGKVRGYRDGKLCWITEPILKNEYQLEELAIKKEMLLKDVSTAILIIQDEVDLDIATSDDKAKLAELKKYRVKLNKSKLSDIENIKRPKY